MARKCNIQMLWILLSVLLFNRGISSDIVFTGIDSIFTNLPIINATMYVDYPKLWELDMSNQTGFEFPVDQVLLVHEVLSRYLCNNCGVHHIYRLSLTKIPQLTHLILNNNSLKYIHPDVFEYNTHLEKVTLVGNQLVNINPEATIRHISSLSILDLSWNEQLDLNRLDIQGTRLMFLTCNHCNTTFLERKTLASMPRLSQLSLSFNSMDWVNEYALVQSKYAKILKVDGNRGLTRLNIRSESLMKLSAQGCSLEGTLDTSQLPLLEYLNVRENRIARLDEHGFQQNPDIKVVLLDDNEIEKIPTRLLKLPLNSLKQLCLDRNPLQPCHQADEARVLYSTRRLRRSCLDDGDHLHKFEYYLPSVSGKAVYKKNPIHDLSSDGSVVDLSNRAIVYIEQEYLIDEQNVTEVIFDDNHNFDFQQDRIYLESSSVERISLKNCSITAIYETTFRKLPNLKSLVLQGNQIRSINSNSLFKQNLDIAFLSLSHNDLEFISTNAFQNLSQLEVLNLDWNSRLSSTINAPFLLSTSLRNVSCSNCRFVRLDSLTLAGLPNLLELNLEHNYIATVDDDAFQRTPKLTYLNLRNNQLVVFEPKIGQLGHLKTLCLSGSPKFDFERVLVDDILKMMNLDRDCGDDKFSNRLAEWYKVKAKEETENLSEQMSLLKSEITTAAFSSAGLVIPTVLAVFAFSITEFSLYFSIL